MTTNVREWYFGKNLLRFDVGSSIALVVVPTWVILNHECGVHEFLQKDGTAAYGAILSSLAALLGFAIAAIAIIASLVSGETFKTLRESSHYDEFWLAFTWSVRTLAVAALAALTAMFTNQVSSVQILSLIGVLLTVACATLSLARSGYTLEIVLQETRGKKPAVTTVADYPAIEP